MEVSSLTGLSSAMSQVDSRDVVGTAVLKKAMDIQAQNAMQLLEALPKIPSNPPNLGNSVDVRV
jgi:hypothetical protein